MDVARRIFHKFSTDLAIDNNGMLLGNVHVVMQIVELLLEEDVP